jgi:hypothetical protein
MEKIKKVFECCFISVTHGLPNILLNNHLVPDLYDAMDSVFFEDVEWSWMFGEDNLNDGVYKCTITITNQDEWGIYFHIDNMEVITSFDSNSAQICKNNCINHCPSPSCQEYPRV